MIYLKLVPFNFKIDTHDQRETSVAKELGFDVIVADLINGDEEVMERWEGYTIYHLPNHLPARAQRLQMWLHLNGIANFCKMIAKSIQIHADIVSGHDYFLLLAAYIANFFKRKKAKLIYDSHEFELYRYAPNRTGFQRTIIKLIEGFLIRRVDLAVMVGDKIADGVQEIYCLTKRPTVVRNIPSYWYLLPERAAEIRQSFFEQLKISNSGFLLMYHGGVSHGRGIEYAIQSLAYLPEDIGLVVMGAESEVGVIHELQSMAREMGVERRIFFKEPVPFKELKSFIGAVDVELVLQSAWCINILYSLPNKFFESIQACVPLICCDLPEMGKLVKQYDIGLLVQENNAKEVAEAVLRLRSDRELYDRLKRNMEKAKEELCWEKEGLKLKDAIQQIMEKRNV